MPRLFRVKGPSMEPTLRSGDIVLLRRRKAKKGDIVVVDHARFGRIIKRVSKAGQLEGDGVESTDADRLGPFDPATLVGVAVLAITPAGLRRL